MRVFPFLSGLTLTIFLGTCVPAPEKEAVSTPEPSPTREQIDYLGITDPDHLSAASKRALNWPADSRSSEWFIEYRVEDLKGDLAYEEGVVRRDPSAVVKVGDTYYVWYSRSTGPVDGFGGDTDSDKVFPWDRCDIWYATSADGITWKERGLAVARGKKGTFDDRSVFTVECLEHDGHFYLTYQTVGGVYDVRVKNQVGMAHSSSPDGPWTKLPEPILSPADNGVWRGTEQNRFAVEKKGDFDSHKVHDPCLLHYRDKWYLYYKGEQMGEEITFGGRQIRHGVAIAETPFGPYKKSPYNPISNSGHEICVWHHAGGIASLITTDGPEKNTMQWSPDGINFEIKSYIKGAPHAIGLVRSLNDSDDPLDIMQWGLTHQYAPNPDYQYIRRFTSERKKRHVAKGESASK
jgi:hypothetical protein